eukprot:7039582-Prymnesium_polylepis.1
MRLACARTSRMTSECRPHTCANFAKSKSRNKKENVTRAHPNLAGPGVVRCPASANARPRQGRGSQGRGFQASGHVALLRRRHEVAPLRAVPPL